MRTANGSRIEVIDKFIERNRSFLRIHELILNQSNNSKLQKLIDTISLNFKTVGKYIHKHVLDKIIF